MTNGCWDGVDIEQTQDSTVGRWDIDQTQGSTVGRWDIDQTQGSTVGRWDIEIISCTFPFGFFSLLQQLIHFEKMVWKLLKFSQCFIEALYLII